MVAINLVLEFVICWSTEVKTRKILWTRRLDERLSLLKIIFRSYLWTRIKCMYAKMRSIQRFHKAAKRFVFYHITLLEYIIVAPTTTIIIIIITPSLGKDDT